MSAKAGSANLITGTRILCSIALLFCQTFSPPFFALYIIAGLTDGTSTMEGIIPLLFSYTQSLTALIISFPTNSSASKTFRICSG